MEKKLLYSAPTARYLDVRFEISFLQSGNLAGDPLNEDPDYTYDF